MPGLFSFKVVPPETATDNMGVDVLDPALRKGRHLPRHCAGGEGSLTTEWHVAAWEPNPAVTFYFVLQQL